MRTTSVFKSGNSQAVRIPADLAFPTERVTIELEGDAIILRPARPTMRDLIDGLPIIPDFPFIEDDTSMDDDPEAL